MTEWSHNSTSAGPAGLTLAAFDHALGGWFLHGEIDGWSARTMGDYRSWTRRLRTFLVKHDAPFCTDSLRLFFVSLKRGDGGGATRPLSATSLKHVHVILMAFSNWCVLEGFLPTNPVKGRIPAPKPDDPGIVGFDDDELVRLIDAASRSRNALRDVALVKFMADTGVRASELASLRMEHIQMSARTALIECGKGGKPRQVSFGAGVAKALWHYLRDEPTKGPKEPLFTSCGGGAMDRYALLKVCKRLGEVSGVKDVHPHRFRHDAAIRMLRNGAHAFAVMQQLGHSKIQTTQIYVQLAARDLSAAHAAASPIDNLRASRRANQ